VAIDLFYARLKVSACPPPPQCWLPHASLPAEWLPVSALWATPVCRLLPPDINEGYATVHGPIAERYYVYITPIPSIQASLAVLQALPPLAVAIPATAPNAARSEQTGSRSKKVTNGLKKEAISRKQTRTSQKKNNQQRL
jgi:hypothetical protein